MALPATRQPSTSLCGSCLMISRSLQVPGSPSSALTTRYLGLKRTEERIGLLQSCRLIQCRFSSYNKTIIDIFEPTLTEMMETTLKRHSNMTNLGPVYMLAIMLWLKPIVLLQNGVATHFGGVLNVPETRTRRQILGVNLSLPSIIWLIHERPFDTSREPSSTATTQTRFHYLLLQPFIALQQDFLRFVPVSLLTGKT